MNKNGFHHLKQELYFATPTTNHNTNHTNLIKINSSFSRTPLLCYAKWPKKLLSKLLLVKHFVFISCNKRNKISHLLAFNPINATYHREVFQLSLSFYKHYLK